MKNIHIVEKNNLQIFGVSYYGKSSSQIEIEQFLMTRKIYITSDKEIKEGDWFIHTSQQIKKCESIVGKSIVIDNGKSSLWSDKSKKIILTTDQDLINDGVQPIDDEFLEWFVENPSCEAVEVSTYHVKGDISGKLHYKTIISQEQTTEEVPIELEPVLAKISHQNDLGNPNWYEVVYYVDGKWCSYSGSKTFEDGERVVEWVHCSEIF